MEFKLIIFDMDGTLYDLSDVIQMCYEMQLKYICIKENIGEKEAKQLLDENHIYPEIKNDSKSATELFLQIGYNKEEWSAYRTTGFDEKKIDLAKAVDEKTIGAFSRYCRIVLLSSNAYGLLERILAHLNISIAVFDEIICSDKFPYDEPFKKKRAMEYLVEKYRVSFKSILSIGDRYKTDIEPVIELGGKGILLQRPAGLVNVYEDYVKNNLHSCESYTFYSCE